MPEFFNNSIEGFQKLLNELQKVKKELLDIAKINQKAVSGINPAKAKTEDINKLAQAEQNLIKTEKELVKVTIEELKFAKKIKDAKSDENKVRQENKLLLADANKKAKESAKISLGLTDAYAQESKRLNDLRKKYRNLAVQNKENTKVGQKYLAQITKLDSKLKRIDKSVGQNFRSVGDYKGAISTLTPVLGTFGSKLNQIQATLGAAKEGFKKMAGAQEGAAKSSKILSFAMKAIPIFAIIGAITALIGVFAGTQRGMDAITKITRPLVAIFDKLLGVIQDVAFWFADKLGEAFDNPMQAIKDLGQVILDNIINRFKAVFVLGDALAELFKGNLKEAAKLGADGFIQLGSGITNATDKIIAAGEAISEFVDESVLAGLELDNLIKQFERLELKSLVPIAKLKIEFQKLKAIANDQLKTDEERIKALEDAEEVQRKISGNEQRLLDLKIQAMELQHSLNDTTREDEKELQLLLVERLQFEEKAQKKIAGIISLKTGIQLRAAKLSIASDIAEAKRIQDLADLEKKRHDDEIAFILEEWRLREKKEKDLLDLVEETSEEEDIISSDALRKELKDHEDAEKEKAAQTIKFAQDITSQLGEELNIRLDNQKNALKDEENDIEDNISRQQELAAKGLDNTLAFEKEKLAKNQIEQIEAEKKAAQVKEAIRLGELFLTLKEAEAKEKVQGSTARALQGVAEAKAITEGIKASLDLAGFKEGGYTGDGGENEIAGVTHGKEFVINAPTTAALGLKGADMGDFKNMMSMHEMNKTDRVVQDKDGNFKVIKAVENLEQTLKNKPEHFIDLDKFGNIISNVRKGNFTKRVIRKTGSRL